jgi:cytochrome c556
MKYNINIIKSAWRRWSKPSQSTLDAISSQSSQNMAPTRALDSSVWQQIAQLEADRRDLLTMAKAVVHLRDANVHPRPSSEMIRVLRDTIAAVERRRTAARSA